MVYCKNRTIFIQLQSVFWECSFTIYYYWELVVELEVYVKNVTLLVSRLNCFILNSELCCFIAQLKLTKHTRAC